VWVSYAIVFVSDMKKSVAFYRDEIGLPLRFESPHWTESLRKARRWHCTPARVPGPRTIRRRSPRDAVVQGSGSTISTRSTNGWWR